MKNVSRAHSTQSLEQVEYLEPHRGARMQKYGEVTVCAFARIECVCIVQNGWMSDKSFAHRKRK